MKNSTILLATLGTLAWPLLASVPHSISYQGRVQVSGTNFTGPGQFKFALVSPGTNLSRQATAAATLTGGFVTSITVIDGGNGYTVAPSVMITDPTGGGATAVAQVFGGIVTNIAVQDAGSGYSAPTVTIAPPPAAFVYGTFWSNDASSSAGSEPAGAVSVPVHAGLFTVLLGDSGLANMMPISWDVFQNPNVYLRVWFNDGQQGFRQLSPDQPVAAVGYAMMAAQVSAAGLPAGGVGTATLQNAAVTTEKLATNAVTSERIQDASIVAADLSPSLLGGTFWRLAGNGGTGTTNFVGTTDAQPLELRVNGQRALRLEPAADSQFGLNPNVIGGTSANRVTGGGVGSTIGGGTGHSILTRFATISGGYVNSIRSNSFDAAIGGGGSNLIDTNSNQATIGGGSGNSIGGNSFYATVSGGNDNDIAGDSSAATVAGGNGNDIGPNSAYSTVGGGNNNDIGTNAAYAVIPGGDSNFAASRSFAAGRRAKANHVGAFVWGDGQNADVASTNNNSVTMRAIGGYRLFSNLGLSAGAYLASGASSWTSVSDRNAKENFEPVNARAVLEKVITLPVSTWNYKSQEPGVRHIGPMAQDFKSAFGVGESDTGITTVDADGVALAAIQGLNQKLEEKDAEVKLLKQRLAALEKVLKLLSARENP